MHQNLVHLFHVLPSQGATLQSQVMRGERSLNLRNTESAKQQKRKKHKTPDTPQQGARGLT